MRGRKRLYSEQSSPILLGRNDKTPRASITRPPIDTEAHKPSPTWHIEPPLGSPVVHSSDRFTVSATVPATGERSVVCQLNATQNEYLVIHYFALLGWEEVNDPDVLPTTQLMRRDMQKHTIWEKLYWDVVANQQSLFQVSRGREGGTVTPSPGFRSLEEYSFPGGNTPPIIVAPNTTAELVVVGIDPSAGNAYSPFGSYLEGRLSGYRVSKQYAEENS